MPFLFISQNLSYAKNALGEVKVRYTGAWGINVYTSSLNSCSTIVHVQSEGDKDLTSVLQVSGMSFGQDLLIESVIANIEENA